MIFSNKIYRITSGDNPHIYAKNSNTMELYLFNEQIHKNIISLENSIIRCFNTLIKFDKHYVGRIDDNLICTCFDENISIVEGQI